MKHILTGLIAAIFVTSAVMPVTAQALSCLDPAGMIEYYVSQDDYQVFTATAGQIVEHVSEKASTDGDPNFQYDSGYTGQYVEVTEAHKGYVDEMFWVYYEKNSTWGYLCAGGPAVEGEETLYIVSQRAGLFDLPQVVNSYAVDSPLATDIVAALSEAGQEGGVSEVSKEDWKNRLRTQMQEMIFIIGIKLSEWQWWNR